MKNQIQTPLRSSKSGLCSLDVTFFPEISINVLKDIHLFIYYCSCGPVKVQFYSSSTRFQLVKTKICLNLNKNHHIPSKYHFMQQFHKRVYILVFHNSRQMIFGFLILTLLKNSLIIQPCHDGWKGHSVFSELVIDIVYKLPCLADTSHYTLQARERKRITR